jgi:G:T-mismatch repair DNA endonuclease (very short patch repair protein)
MRKATIEDFIFKSNKIHNNKYDYSKSIYTGKDDKIEIICLEHGSFWQISNNHMRGAKCPKCAKKQLKNNYSKEGISSFINNARIIHKNNYDYSKVTYTNQHNKVEIICPIHGSFWQVPFSHLKGSGCSLCWNERKGLLKFEKAKNKFIEEAKKVHGDIYDYSKFVYVHSRTNSEVLCKKHGPFICNPNNHLRGRSCPICAYELRGENCRSNTEEFIEKANKIHNNFYDYSKVNYTLSKDKVEIICPIHGSFFQNPNNHLEGKGCSSCIHNKDTKPERALRDFLIENNIEFLPNDRIALEGKEIDIFIPSLNLGIEINGLYWHCELHKENDAHLKKLLLAESRGIKLIQIWDSEIENPVIFSKIKHILKKNSEQRIFARECNIKDVDSKIANEFLEKNHIQGKDNSKTRYGLFFKDELVALMTFATPRFNENYEWELIRYATSQNIVGGASRLLTHFERTIKPKSLISYADRRFTHTENNVYSKIGFKCNGTSKPNYFYINTNNKDIIKRYNAQKHKLSKFLENYDRSLTEVENMNNNGYYRVFDCGNLVFTKEYNAIS